MIKLNIHEAKTHLSKYLAKLKAGDRILLCKRNQPVAEIIDMGSLLDFAPGLPGCNLPAVA